MKKITEQDIRGLKVGDKVKLFIDHVQGEQWVVFAGKKDNEYVFIDTGDLLGMNYGRQNNDELLEDIKTIIPARYGDKPFLDKEQIKELEYVKQSLTTHLNKMIEDGDDIVDRSDKEHGIYLIQSIIDLKQPPLPSITEGEIEEVKLLIKAKKRTADNYKRWLESLGKVASMQKDTLKALKDNIKIWQSLLTKLEPFVKLNKEGEWDGKHWL